jgi:hypothetical protein
MKLDPGVHVGLHLVFFGKTGVTALCILSMQATRPYLLFATYCYSIYINV